MIAYGFVGSRIEFMFAGARPLAASRLTAAVNAKTGARGIIFVLKPRLITTTTSWTLTF
jgi:hypothetical protein